MTPPMELMPVAIVIFLSAAFGGFLGAHLAFWNKKLDDGHGH